MLFRELNRGKCKTYLLGSEQTHRAVLIDPIKDKVVPLTIAPLLDPGLDEPRGLIPEATRPAQKP